ncbi:GAF domain-containing protein [Roseibacterium sp. SDUM158016]|uniref:GAF domain-containing protein n=1 Tax=Roseicyclus sediminis TaxID=2980997 RepID=UPI0021CF6620|nr:GAF domain-containing protein [Roseibacterium sp. SDUM158016]MCU4651615.1 GAF domain-containing protein [Roseibacterium sp. SDUM158016]
MSALESQAIATVLDRFRKYGGVVRTLKIAGTVIGASLVAASPWVGAQGFQSASNIESLMLFGGLFLAVLSSLALVFLDQTTPDLVAENIDILKENERLRAEILYANSYQDHLLARITVSSQVNKLVEEAVSEGCSTREQASKFAQSILGIFAERRQSLFGIGDEYWNFGVYVYDSHRKKLICIACRRDRKEDQEASHREWEPGNGHVGLAFSRGTEIIFADATVAELRPVLEATGENFREYDYTRYKSLASIPISSDGENPLGVLIATSDKAGRYKSDRERTDDDWENTGSLREVAESLAIILRMTHAANIHGGQTHDSDGAGGA